MEERKKFRDSFVAILLAISMVVGLVPVSNYASYANKSAGNVKSVNTSSI